MLYRVRVGEDEYLGSAEEVVAFMARSEGAPGGEPSSYMEGVAKRLAKTLGVTGIDASSPEAFLDDLAARGIVPIETLAEPVDQRVDPEEALGDGPVAYGPGVDPHDVPA